MTRLIHRTRFFPLLVAATLLAACPQEPPAVGPGVVTRELVEITEANEALRTVSDVVLREFVDDGDWTSLRTAIDRNRTWLARKGTDHALAFGPRTVPAGELDLALATLDRWLAEDMAPEVLATRLGELFEPMVNLGDGRGDMLVTGYYEPLIAGSRKRTAEYDVPVYGPPPDLFRIALGDFRDEWSGRTVTGLLSGRRLLPYPERREIRESGRLRGREIAWARDLVDLFFVEVQGSGALQLPDGSEIRIGYAGANGRQYRSIGKLLIDEGAIPRERMSMQALRSWLRDHPEEIHRILDYNESQVFFRRLDGPPVGSLGIAVTPGRSVAADHSLLPAGALGFLLSEVPGTGPSGETIAERPLRRFVFNHDTGGAIRGADRADFFWGRGDEAAMRAGLMKQPGRLYFLVPRSRADSSAGS